MRALCRLFFFCFACWAVSSCGGESDDEEVPGLITASAGCGDASTGSDENPQGFGIASRSPMADASQCALVTAISIEFTQPLMEQTLSSETVFLTQDDGVPVAAQLSYSAGSESLLLTPDAPLLPQTRYTVTVTEDLMASDGSLFPGESWRFETAGNIGPTTQAVIADCMSDIDLEMLAQINDARASARNCGDQPVPAASALAWHCSIDAAAQEHSDDMADNNFFSHTGSDGTSVGDRLTNIGYQWLRAGENIAAGQTSVSQVMAGLLDSPGHCLNIMNRNFTEMGAALAENSATDYGLYWTQNFAQPR